MLWQKRLSRHPHVSALQKQIPTISLRKTEPKAGSEGLGYETGSDGAAACLFWSQGELCLL